MTARVPVVLAPMAGVTNAAFRQLCAEQGAGLYVCEMITSRGTVEGDAEIIGDGVAFAGVAKFPARVKCALLGWKAFQAATSDALGESHAPEDKE